MTTLQSAVAAQESKSTFNPYSHYFFYSSFLQLLVTSQLTYFPLMASIPSPLSHLGMTFRSTIAGKGGASSSLARRTTNLSATTRASGPAAAAGVSIVGTSTGTSLRSTTKATISTSTSRTGAAAGAPRLVSRTPSILNKPTEFRRFYDRGDLPLQVSHIYSHHPLLITIHSVVITSHFIDWFVHPFSFGFIISW